MSSSASLFLLISAVLLLSSAATSSAFNITIILSRYPGFEQFNQLLSQTLLAENINRRRTITVLGLPNDRMASIMQMTEDMQRSILSLHIILDYYDMIKLNKLPPASKTELTTLYQSTGVADNQQGFINVIRRRDGTILFGSAVPGSPQVSMLVNAVAAQPFNISVLSVSQPIIAPGMDGSWTMPTEPLPTLEPAPAPKKRSPPPAASPIEVYADEPPASAPSPADSPASAPAPASEAAPAEEEAPAADEGESDVADDSAEKKKNAAEKRVASGVTVGLVIGLTSLVLAVAGH